ncbi:hypothetical protein [Lichenibacterium dinghuense]|jgi:hypothetical protein|uniref:hypothetical protein n=1 Tax=Lichenibacterium dinghuense TaxID=2895977 RepID=UPI001F17CF69|nr:hypothetical protein [Lichenibacterium sp. 6Y81]
MPENEIKEEVAGAGDETEKVEMDRLVDGEFEVTVRYLPSFDPDTDDAAETLTSRRKFTSRTAAETRYADVLAWLHSLAAPR